MEKLREAVINLASSNLNAELSSSQIALIDQRLLEIFPHGLRVPSHPTYATMVLKAITELHEENGSSEDTISEYIKENYDDLPWGHKSILNHHLNKLSGNGVIVLTATNRYLTSPGKQFMMKQRVIRQQNSGAEVLEEHNLVSENQDSTVSDIEVDTRQTQKSCDQLLKEDEISVDGDHTEVREIVYAITKQLPMTTITKEHQNKFRSSELQKKDLSFTRQDNHPVGGVTKKLRIKLKKRDNLELLLSKSSQETKDKWPSWIPSLLQANFNGKCEVHENEKNNICNIFCSYCKRAVCSSCVTSHGDHHVIPIKQCDFEILVEISDVGMFDLSGIRTIEESIVLRKENASLNGVRGNSSCFFRNCKSRVPYPLKFCSLKCKFEHDVNAG